MSEAEIQSLIIKELRRAGMIVSRNNAGRRGGVHLAASGMPDLIVLNPIRRRAVWLEVKGPGGKLREVQEEMIGLMRKCGLRVEVVSSVEEAWEAVCGNS